MEVYQDALQIIIVWQHYLNKLPTSGVPNLGYMYCRGIFADLKGQIHWQSLNMRPF